MKKGHTCARRLRYGPAFLALIGSLVACRTETVSLQQRPTDPESARAVAALIARRSGCTGFEDYDLNAKGHWDFTCQVGDQMFLLRSVSSSLDRATRIAELRAANQPFESGETWLIWEFDSPGQSQSATHLARFRDALR